MRLPDLRALAVVAAAAAIAAATRGAASAATAPSAAPTAVASPAAAAVPAAQPCVSADLVLREVSTTGGALPVGVYALRNRAATACRIAGGAGIRLFDAQGKPIPLRLGPKSAMPMLLTLAPGDEASFTITYGRRGVEQCSASARIELYLESQTTPVSAPASFVACAFPAVRISDLRATTPSPSPAQSPSPAPSPLPSSSALVL